MDDELATEAVRALRFAAERLGVDPLRLARFLSGGRLADVMEAVGSRNGKSAHRLELAEEFLQFLDREIEERQRPPRMERGGD